jgi:LysM repeat protein
MSAQEQNVEQKSDSRSDSTTKTPESAVKEASAGKEDLVSGIKKAIDLLKNGGRSGITNEFGKPLIIDEMIDKQSKQSNDLQTSKRFVTGEIKAVKSFITGEIKIPDVFGQARMYNENVVAPIASQFKDVLQAAQSRDTSTSQATDAQSSQPTDSRKTAADGPQEASKPAGDRGAVQMDAVTITASPDIAYKGEVINRDVPPGTHTVERGDTLTKIAKEHLGPGATPEEIRAHVKEIARVNHIPNPDLIRDGQELVLPGHTADGGFVTKDNAGSTLTRWQDGTERVENKDKTGFVRKPAEDGSGAYTEHHWGPQPENNFELTKTADGKFLFADKQGDQPKELYDQEKVRTERERVMEQAESNITNPEELAKFRANMAEFEQRAHKQGLPPEEVAKFYSETSRLLESKGDQPVSQKDRTVLAEQLMDQAAHPTQVDQGYHNSCNVTTVESRVYTRNPSEAAKMVTDVATTGQYTARDGTVVTVPPGSLTRDNEAQGNPPAYGERSYASQVFQVTAVNLHHQTTPYTYTDSAGTVHNVPAGGMRYEQIPNPVSPDTGERLYDTTTNPPTLVGRSPALTDDGIVRVNNLITGDTGTGAMIDHAKWVYGDKTGVTTVNNEKEFNEQLAKAQAEGRMPIIIHVHTGNEPFLHDSGGGSAGGSGGDHVVTVTGYEAGPPAKVHVDNQWGEGVDYQGNKSMSVHDLYGAMRGPTHPDTIADLQKDVKWDREHGTIDTRKEFELLRLEHNLKSPNPNAISDADFDRLMKEQMTAAADRWKQQKADGTLNEAEQRNGMEKLMDMVHSQPPDRQLGWIEHMHKQGLLTDAQYDTEITKSIVSSRSQWAAEDANTPSTGNPAERRRARAALQDMLNALPADRRQAIMDNSR